MTTEANLQSDGWLINNAQKTPHEQGTMWMITLPDGDEFGAVLQDQSAAAVSAFCNMIRTEWNERKEEQEAKAARRAFDSGESASEEVRVPETQETYQLPTAVYVTLLQHITELENGLSYALQAYTALGDYISNQVGNRGEGASDRVVESADPLPSEGGDSRSETGSQESEE